jgi:hypothetical protein
MGRRRHASQGGFAAAKFLQHQTLDFFLLDLKPLQRKTGLGVAQTSKITQK